MTSSTQQQIRYTPPAPETASELALRLAHAENALRTLTSGQVDAIIDPEGKTYLLRPAQEDLRRNEQRLQGILDSAADAITVVDRGGVILSQSRASKRVLGYESEKLVGKRIFELVHEEDLPTLYIAYFNVIEGFEEQATVRFRHRDEHGLERPIEAMISALRGFSPERVVFCSRPVTMPTSVPALPLPSAASPAAVKDRFLAMLSHELRTPLTPALLGVAELLDDERFAEARPVLTMIRRNIELQSRLLEELTDFTTVGQHKVRLQLAPVDGHEHIQHVLEICRSEIAAAHIELRCDLRATKTTVLADTVRLQQVMWNLVKNAIKFSPRSSVISIATSNETPGFLTIDITDHGIGIEPELLPRVFDAFQQGNGKTHQQYSGLGLGLFIAQGLAEAQNGTLTAHSDGHGLGATLRLTVPIVPSGEIVPSTEKSTRLFPPTKRPR
jgi:two-component system CheB/CheR fusion protein